MKKGDEMHITRKEINGLWERYKIIKRCEDYPVIMRAFKGKQFKVSLATLEKIAIAIGRDSASYLCCVFQKQYNRLRRNGDCFKDCENCWGGPTWFGIEQRAKLLQVIKRYVTERRVL